MSIFSSYYLHWITRRLCSVRHPSGAGCSKCLTFCMFEIWEIWHFCVKVSNTATNFVVKRCKSKYWIAFCRCSRAIWIASEWKANFHAPLTRCFQFAFLSDAIHMAREHRQNAIQCLNIALCSYSLYPTLHILKGKRNSYSLWMLFVSKMYCFSKGICVWNVKYSYLNTLWYISLQKDNVCVMRSW